LKSAGSIALPGSALALALTACRGAAPPPPAPAPDAAVVAEVLAVTHVPVPDLSDPAELLAHPPMQLTCPPGSEVRGDPPPAGHEVYCEKDGKRVGLSIRWHHETDTIAEVQTWKDSKRNGAAAQWDKDGSPLEAGVYRDDLRTGHWTTFQEGKKAFEGDFLDDLQHGHFVAYAGNGQKQGEGEFRKGQPCGTFQCWDWETGNPTGCVPLDGMCPLTPTGAQCKACPP
jgi:hypothetical protein